MEWQRLLGTGKSSFLMRNIYYLLIYFNTPFFWAIGTWHHRILHQNKSGPSLGPEEIELLLHLRMGDLGRLVQNFDPEICEFSETMNWREATSKSYPCDFLTGESPAMAPWRQSALWQDFRVYLANQQSLTKFLVHCCLQWLSWLSLLTLRHDLGEGAVDGDFTWDICTLNTSWDWRSYPHFFLS